MGPYLHVKGLKPTPYLGNFCSYVCVETFSTNQIVGLFKLQYLKKQFLSRNPDFLSSDKTLLEPTN